VNSGDLYPYRLIGKLTVFLQLQEFNLYKPTVDYSTSTVRFSLHRSKASRDIIDDVEKLDAIQDGFVVYGFVYYKSLCPLFKVLLIPS